MYFLNEFMKNITARRYIDFQHNLSKILIIRPNLIIYTLKPIELRKILSRLRVELSSIPCLKNFFRLPRPYL